MATERVALCRTQKVGLCTRYAAIENDETRRRINHKCCIRIFILSLQKLSFLGLALMIAIVIILTFRVERAIKREFRVLNKNIAITGINN
jgi:hypothetical protein